MKHSPKVSVVTITYNQQAYIRETLEGFVKQQTTFPFEVIVADDHSTDDTPKIIAEYAQAYPAIFKPVLRKKNIGAVPNMIDSLQQTTGEYVAVCEGDDYWTDPTKLQRQADFLDSHPDYSLCFHPVRVFFENKENPDVVYPDTTTKATFTVKRLLKEDFIQTNSVMYRRQDYTQLPDDVMPLDWFLHLYHAHFGKIGFIDRVMAAYRRHAGGIWWDYYENAEKIWRKYGLAYIALYTDLLKYYGQNKTYRDIIYGSLEEIFGGLMDLDKKYEDNLVVQALTKYPENAEIILINQRAKLTRQTQQLQELQAANKQQAELVEAYAARIQELEANQQHLEAVINKIYNSKSWRLLRAVRAPSHMYKTRSKR